MAGMDLFLRKVDHVQAKDNYRVILKTEEGELEIGSIGIQYHAGPDPLWIWASTQSSRCGSSKTKASARTAPTA